MPRPVRPLPTSGRARAIGFAAAAVAFFAVLLSMPAVAQDSDPEADSGRPGAPLESFNDLLLQAYIHVDDRRDRLATLRRMAEIVEEIYERWDEEWSAALAESRAVLMATAERVERELSAARESLPRIADELDRILTNPPSESDEVAAQIAAFEALYAADQQRREPLLAAYAGFADWLARREQAGRLWEREAETTSALRESPFDIAATFSVPDGEQDVVRSAIALSEQYLEQFRVVRRIPDPVPSFRDEEVRIELMQAVLDEVLSLMEQEVPVPEILASTNLAAELAAWRAELQRQESHPRDLREAAIGRRLTYLADLQSGTLESVRRALGAFQTRGQAVIEYSDAVVAPLLAARNRLVNYQQAFDRRIASLPAILADCRARIAAAEVEQEAEPEPESESD